LERKGIKKFMRKNSWLERRMMPVDCGGVQRKKGEGRLQKKARA